MIKNFTFGAFRLDAAHRLLTRDTGEAVPLTPKAFELLLTLIESEGRLLTKAELMNRIWPDSFVEEGNLTQTISVLRKALGEHPNQHRYIMTEPGQGYRFVADVHETEERENEWAEEETLLAPANDREVATKQNKPDIQPQTLAPSSLGKNRVTVAVAGLIVVLLLGAIYWLTRPAQPPKTVIEVKSIAVLPFKNIGGEADEEYLGQGLAEVLTTKLSNLKTIVVRPTSAVMKYGDASPDPKKIGSDLNVEAVVMGRVQKVDENIRITVLLVRVSDGATLWAETFDDKFTHIFAVQDSISEQVTNSLALTLTTGERQQITKRYTTNTEAFQLYLQGRFFWNKRTADGLQKAVEHFNRAVQLDPNFAQAHAALAETYVIYNFYAANYDREAFSKGRAAATRALEIDGELAEAHAALGLVKSQYEFDWDGAEKSYLRAIELNPNYPTARQWYGEFLAFRSRTDESLAQMRKAIELDPTSLSTNTAPALPYLISGQFEKALEVTGKVLEMDANFAIALHYKARALFRLGKPDEAIETVQKAVVASNGSMYFKADLGSLYARAGRAAEARKVLAELHQLAKARHVSPHNFAMLYTALNERELAFEYLRKTVAEHDLFVITLPVSVAFENLRDDPRFIEILRQANL